MPMTPAPLDAALAVHGLCVLGQVTASRQTKLPDIGPGRPAAAIVLVGHVGSSLWSSFSASPEYRDGKADPLDRWSRRVGGALAARFEARALYPFDGPPFHPFQRWAVLARKLQHSPLGILIDPEFGLWHAWRFALLLPEALVSSMPMAGGDSPCVTCSGKPCLDACPVGAPRLSGFAHEVCIRHLQTADGEPCRVNGCLSRSACPVAAHARYSPAHASFHMQAFIAGLEKFGNG